MRYSHDFSRHQQVEVAVTLYDSHDFSRRQQVEVAVTQRVRVWCHSVDCLGLLNIDSLHN